MSNQFGKITIAVGQQVLEDVGGTGLSGVLIGNESGLTCKITLQGAGVVRTLYPGTVDFFAVPSGKTWSGNLQIDPSADLSNINSWPGSYVIVDTFGLNEKPDGTFPMTLNRAGNIGNQVTLVAGSSTSVQNDNNAAGTTVVEATVLGSPTSNVSILNDGSGWFGMWVNPTFTKVFQWFSSGTTVLKLAAANLLTEILGNLKVDGTTELAGAATADSTLAVTGNTSLSTLSTSGAATLNSAAVTNNETVGGTLGVTGAINASSNIIEANAISMQWKDSGGTARTVMQVDGGNNVQLFGVTGNDKIQFLKSDGTLQGSWDLINAILNITGAVQTVNGDTSGTMSATEIINGPIKIVLLKQNNYRQAGAAQLITLKNAFTFLGFIINAGCGGIVQATANVVNSNGQITWGTGTSAGTNAANTQIPLDAAAFSSGAFTQVGSNGGYASAHTGIGIYIGQ